jgi:hypothetical protein
MYNGETIECDIERQIIPIDDGSLDCIIFRRTDRASLGQYSLTFA